MISAGTRAKSKNAVMSLLRKVHFIRRPRGIRPDRGVSLARPLGSGGRTRVQHQVGGPGLGNQGHQVQDQTHRAVAQDRRAGKTAEAAEPVVQRLDHGLDAAEKAIDVHAHALLGVAGQEQLAAGGRGSAEARKVPSSETIGTSSPRTTAARRPMVETVSSGASDMHSSTWLIGTT